MSIPQFLGRVEVVRPEGLQVLEEAADSLKVRPTTCCCSCCGLVTFYKAPQPTANHLLWRPHVVEHCVAAKNPPKCMKSCWLFDQCSHHQHSLALCKVKKERKDAAFVTKRPESHSDGDDTEGISDIGPSHKDAFGSLIIIIKKKIN